MDFEQIATLRQEVIDRMQSLQAAERALDASALLEHMAKTPDFCVYNDGLRLGHDELSEGITTTFQSLQSISGGVEKLEVRVLSADYALVTAEFREIVIDCDGDQGASSGVATWLWHKVDGIWRITYGHADHYPEDLLPGEPDDSHD